MATGKIEGGNLRRGIGPEAESVTLPGCLIPLGSQLWNMMCLSGLTDPGQGSREERRGINCVFDETGRIRMEPGTRGRVKL